MRLPLLPTTVLILAIAGCAAPTAKTPVATGPSESVVSAPRLASVVTLTGLVTAPATVVAAGGANVVAPGGANVVAAGGGNVVASGGANYRALAIAESPLADAEVYLADAAGQPVKGVGSVRTDAQGRFSLPRVPAGFAFKVVVAAKDAAGAPVSLETLVKASAGAACDVSGVTTLVTASVSENQAGVLGEFDPSTFTEAVQATQETLTDADVPAWGDRAAIRDAFKKLAKRAAKLQKAADTLQAAIAAKKATRQADLEAALGAIAASPAPSTPAAPPTTAPGALALTVVLDGDADGRLRTPEGLAIRDGQLVVADRLGDRLRSVGLTDGAYGTLFEARIEGFAGVTGVCVDDAKTMYVSLRGKNDKILKITPEGVISTLAGGGTGFADGTGASAQFNNPCGLDTDAEGNIYVADAGNHRIRKVTPRGVVTTIAGGPEAGRADGAGANARFRNPRGVRVGPNGNLWIADTGNHQIRRIGTGGVVTTVAGTGAIGRQDGPATIAGLNAPEGLIVWANGLIVADSGNGQLRRLDLKADTLTTIATDTKLAEPVGLALDGAGQLWVGDRAKNRIVRLKL